MPTKTQAKAAVDSADTAIKADIDNILPTGVNITDGKLFFNPTVWTIRMTAPDQATALSWSATIQTNLTAASRTFTVDLQLGRRVQDTGVQKAIVISTALCIYTIMGF